jgi:hypothetical protein
LFEIPLADAVDTEGVPTGYAKLGQTSILLSPVPNESQVLDIVYHQTPDRLVNLADESILPTTCHEAVIFYACAIAHSKDQNYDAAAHFRQAYQDVIANYATPPAKQSPTTTGGA